MKVALFDIDGTILDSLYIWENLSQIYLSEFGIQVEDSFLEKIKNMNLEESSQYMKTIYKLKKTQYEILTEIKSILKYYYEEKFLSKNGVIDYLTKLHNNKTRLAVATTLDSDLTKVILQRLSILDLFEKIYCEDEMKISKRSHKYFEYIVKDLEVSAKDICLFEDSLYAISSAKKVGIKIVGVLDEYNFNYHSDILKLADETIRDFNEMETIEWKKY